jgi:death-on-curing protein
VKYLAAEQILFIHARLIAETGGSLGLRDLGMLLSVAAQPQASYGSQGLYPDVFSTAAALLESLVQSHPFVDGNKRTAIVSAGLFLLQNRRRLTAAQNELERFALRVALKELTLEEMAAWLEEHSQPMSR